MPENFKKMKNDYITDILFVEGKINYGEFLKHHSMGTKDDWAEIRLVALNPVFLKEFLTKLRIETRSRALLRLKNYTLPELSKFGFGGSVFELFDLKTSNTDRAYSNRIARLSIFLDVPIIYLLKNQPSYNDIEETHFLEYRFLGEYKQFHELKELISRPANASVTPYLVENEYGGTKIFNRNNKEVRTRLVLEKTFYSIEFFIDSRFEFDSQKIKWLMNCIDKGVIRVILSTPPLRDSYKLSFIGSYIKEQQVEANNHADELLKYFEGQQIYPPVYRY